MLVLVPVPTLTLTLVLVLVPVPTLTLTLTLALVPDETIYDLTNRDQIGVVQRHEDSVAQSHPASRYKSQSPPAPTKCVYEWIWGVPHRVPEGPGDALLPTSRFGIADQGYTGCIRDVDWPVGLA